jgi:hypothetical protein
MSDPGENASIFLRLEEENKFIIPVLSYVNIIRVTGSIIIMLIGFYYEVQSCPKF